MKNKDFIVDGKKIGYYEDGMIVVTDPDVIKENQPKKTDRFTFGEMLEFLKAGNHMTRNGWKDNYGNNYCCIYLVDCSVVPKEELREGAYDAFKNAYSGYKVTIKPHIDMKADGIICGWTPTTEDMLAEDWHFVID